MYNKNNKKSVTKKVKSSDGVAPNLVVGVKQVSPKKFLITILHPNTKEELYSKTHLAQSIDEAFTLGKQIKEEKFAKTDTWYEEILYIARPKRGKMKLKTKEEADEDVTE